MAFSLSVFRPTPSPPPFRVYVCHAGYEDVFIEGSL